MPKNSVTNITITKHFWSLQLEQILAITVLVGYNCRFIN